LNRTLRGRANYFEVGTVTKAYRAIEKSALARLGVPGFKPHLRKAPERLEDLRTADGTVPANITEELRRNMARLALVRGLFSDLR
jgi:hypothetical protein